MFEIKHPHHFHFTREQAIEKHRQSGGVFYYVLAYIKGEKMLWGAYKSEAEAERIGMTRTNGNFEIIKRNTSDISEVSRGIREEDIEQNGFTPESFRRFGHR